MYIEATELTLNNYVETNFLSRWCGWKKPHVLVSYYNVIVFAYHTDGIERGSSFAGTFEFVDARKMRNILILTSFNKIKSIEKDYFWFTFIFSSTVLDVYFQKVNQNSEIY